jgi:hypothetical protein
MTPNPIKRLMQGLAVFLVLYVGLMAGLILSMRPLFPLQELASMTGVRP